MEGSGRKICKKGLLLGLEAVIKVEEKPVRARIMQKDLNKTNEFVYHITNSLKIKISVHDI
jgi:hypothetical protein